ncbi:hypothetical protein M406DRAFT_72433 [Cryphonectria parasitica EP155]|uniref:AB hydrolase-1 domain-containing protein n=1 Tax=Cryphonectria parasitica (strain ATCC 38755 / EP155) TaxID=660469 RepID=A0A9P5CLV3_CRYP1|nr:uncharacterized protein M406DRAFT_72433 [Cryphonectria parasitica EP155]KAF3762426.1 hypothetical protein M406DRAFT_72433 [Cryphonectria parasitica EP155]
MAALAIPAARLIRSAKHVVPGPFLVTEYLFSVPKDYRNPQDGEIQLFARSATKHEASVSALEQPVSQRPWMVYLQGGPGFGNPEPQDFPLTRFVLSKGYQILFLDYRGVGLSTPVTADTIPPKASDQFEYLKHFRQDNNVRDLEAVRSYLTAGVADPVKKKWSIFGQSFGGFVCLSYLSKFPEGLSDVWITGGLAPISRAPREVYQATFKKVYERNMVYYTKFPEDIATVRRIVAYLHAKKGGVQLPGGGRLTARRLLTIGDMFGFHGGLDNVHSMLLRMGMDLDQYGFFTRPTLDQFESYLPFDTSPIYAILHEAIYCYKNGVASNWAAQQVGQELQDFRWLSADNHGFDDPTFASDTTPLCFTGEMIFPFMFDDYPELNRMKETAEMLARYDQWDDLYDEEQLKRNTVPVYAASYIEDMYVDFDLARETASKVNGIKTFETNIMYHNAIRARSDEVLSQLFKLREDIID